MTPDRLFIVDEALARSKTDIMELEVWGDLLGNESKNREKTSQELMKLSIFTAEEEKFAFKRAVSRIYEMQSQPYLDGRIYIYL